MTGEPVDLAELRTPRLADLLLAELDRRPWLLVLDRARTHVFVAYQRTDAGPTCRRKTTTPLIRLKSMILAPAIHPEDDELLRRLAAVAKSKILITSRLTPHALMNRSGIPVPGVRRGASQGLTSRRRRSDDRGSGVSGGAEGHPALPAKQLRLPSTGDRRPGGLDQCLRTRSWQFRPSVDDPHATAARSILES